jgi:hypothetical protein
MSAASPSASTTTTCPVPALPPLINTEPRHHDRRHRHPLEVRAPCRQRRHRPSRLHLKRPQPVAAHHPTAISGDLDDHTRMPGRRPYVLRQPTIHGTGSPQPKSDRSCRSGSIRSIRTAPTRRSLPARPLPDETLLPAHPTCPNPHAEASYHPQSDGSPRRCCTSPRRGAVRRGVRRCAQIGLASVAAVRRQTQTMHRSSKRLSSH